MSHFVIVKHNMCLTTKYSTLLPTHVVALRRCSNIFLLEFSRATPRSNDNDGRSSGSAVLLHSSVLVLTVVALLVFFFIRIAKQLQSFTVNLILLEDFALRYEPSPPSIPINPFFIMSEEVAKAFVAHFYQQFTQGAAGLASLYVS